LLADLKGAAGELGARPGIVDATVFKAILVPPGRGAYLRQRPDIHIARFDVVVLIETATGEDAERIRADAVWKKMEAAARGNARYVTVFSAGNIRRIGEVDHDRDGVFLFNFFAADNRDQNLAVWEYTAGWFQDQTGLDNSTVLLPAAGEASDYTIINHCRWDALRDIVPSLIFKPSFRRYVLANFEANRTAAIPILYRLA
jgi:hypothetical protein